MPSLKKIAFGVVFLIFLNLTIYLIRPWFSNTDFFLTTNFSDFFTPLQEFLLLAVLIILTGLSLVIFVTIAQDWLIIAPIILVAAISSLISLHNISLNFAPTDYVLAVALLIGLFLVAISVFSKMQNYLSFNPSELLTHEVKNAVTLLIICFCVVYFFTTFSQIRQKGFEIPDSLIDQSLSAFSTSNPQSPAEEPIQIPKLSKEEIEFLRANPKLMEERNIDPKILDLVEAKQNQPKNTSDDQSLLKETFKQTLQGYIKPYQDWIAVVLVVIFFSTLSFLVWIPLFFISPILSGIFAILKKANVVTYKKEMKEVDRLVV